MSNDTFTFGRYKKSDFYLYRAYTFSQDKLIKFGTARCSTSNIPQVKYVDTPSGYIMGAVINGSRQELAEQHLDTEVIEQLWLILKMDTLIVDEHLRYTFKVEGYRVHASRHHTADKRLTATALREYRESALNGDDKTLEEWLTQQDVNAGHLVCELTGMTVKRDVFTVPKDDVFVEQLGRLHLYKHNTENPSSKHIVKIGTLLDPTTAPRIEYENGQDGVFHLTDCHSIDLDESDALHFDPVLVACLCELLGMKELFVNAALWYELEHHGYDIYVTRHHIPEEPTLPNHGLTPVEVEAYNTDVTRGFRGTTDEWRLYHATHGGYGQNQAIGMTMQETVTQSGEISPPSSEDTYPFNPVKEYLKTKRQATYPHPPGSSTPERDTLTDGETVMNTNPSEQPHETEKQRTKEMGDYYSEAIDDTRQVLNMSFGEQWVDVDDIDVTDDDEEDELLSTHAATIHRVIEGHINPTDDPEKTMVCPIVTDLLNEFSGYPDYEYALLYEGLTVGRDDTTHFIVFECEKTLLKRRIDYHHQRSTPPFAFKPN